MLPVALAAFALTGCGRDDAGPAGDVEFVLSETAGSGQSATAALIAEGEQILVVIEIDAEPVSESQPAHIHEGICDALTPEPAFELENVSDGRSTTIVDVSLDTLTSGTYAIDLHVSDDDLATHTSCGNIEP